MEREFLKSLAEQVKELETALNTRAGAYTALLHKPGDVDVEEVRKSLKESIDWHRQEIERLTSMLENLK